jgi:hypothetical protein
MPPTDGQHPQATEDHSAPASGRDADPGPATTPAAGDFFIQEREDDMLLCSRGWPFGGCIARRPKLMKNADWRPIAERIVASLASLEAERLARLDAELRVRELEATLEEAKRLLQPFAVDAKAWDADENDGEETDGRTWVAPGESDLTVDDLRRARDFVRSLGGEPEEAGGGTSPLRGPSLFLPSGLEELDYCRMPHHPAATTQRADETCLSDVTDPAKEG